MNTPAESTLAVAAQARPVLIRLLRGPLEGYEDRSEWEVLLRYRNAISAYLAVIGLRLVVNEALSFAYVQQVDDEERPGGVELPRLVPKRPLTMRTSLVALVLRKRLVEHDLTGQPRLVLSVDSIVEEVSQYLPPTANEARQREGIVSSLNKLVALGLVRRLAGDDQRFEVRQILTALVDADWLADLAARIEHYRKELAGESA